MSWTSRKARWFPPVAALLLFVSCNGDPETDPELPPGVFEGSPEIGAGTTATPSAAPTPGVAECPNGSAATDPARQVGPSATSDVDGDGLEDRVRLGADPTGPAGCTMFLVLETGTGATTAAPVWEIGAQGGLPQPQVHGFVDIDGRAGNEILIDEAAGASTQFVGAFVYIDGDLERITFKGGAGSEDIPGAADLFAYGGSVGHVEAVDCVGEAIVVSTATPSLEPGDAEDGIYEIQRRFFTIEGSVLEKEKSEIHDVPIDRLGRFPEYQASPFGSC